MAEFRKSKIPPELRGDGRRLEDMLAKKGRKAVELARYLQLRSAGAVSQWIDESRRIPKGRLLGIARFLKCGPEEISPALARQLAKEAAAILSVNRGKKGGSPLEPHDAQTPPSKAQLRGIAVMGESASWRWDEMLPAEGSVPWNRPGCYALRVMGDAMDPRYRSGEYLVIREDAKPEPDNDVLVVLHDGTAMIRELGSIRDGQVTLRKMAGSRTTLAMSDIQFIHRIVGRSDASEVTLS